MLSTTIMLMSSHWRLIISCWEFSVRGVGNSTTLVTVALLLELKTNTYKLYLLQHYNVTLRFYWFQRIMRYTWMWLQKYARPLSSLFWDQQHRTWVPKPTSHVSCLWECLREASYLKITRVIISHSESMQRVINNDFVILALCDLPPESSVGWRKLKTAGERLVVFTKVNTLSCSFCIFVGLKGSCI